MHGRGTNPRWLLHESTHDTSFKCIILIIFLASGFGERLLTFLQCLLLSPQHFAKHLMPVALLPSLLYSYVYWNLGYLAVTPSSGKLSNRSTEVWMSPRAFHIRIAPFLLYIILVVLSIKGLSPTHNHSYMIKNVWSWVSLKECL